MNLRRFSLVAIIGAGLSGSGAVFLAFGPDLLINFLSQDTIRERDQAVRKQTELLEQNVQLLKGLTDTLQERPEPAPRVEPASRPEPTPVAEPVQVIAAEAAEPSEPVRIDEVAALPQAARPRTPAPRPPAVPQPTDPAPTEPAEPAEPEIVSFGVFPREKFTLCGFSDFTAELVSSHPEVALNSTNRSIPDAGFRGFEARVPLRQPTTLWEGCTVAVDHSTTAGVTRIAISTTKGGSQ